MGPTRNYRALSFEHTNWGEQRHFRRPRKVPLVVPGTPMSLARVLFRSLLSFTLLLVAPLARGQDEAVVVAAEGVDPLQATPIQSEQAQSRFARGKALFTEGKYREAAEEFQASRAIVASPNARLYRARCLVQLGHLIEAYVEFGRTMVQSLELTKHEVRYKQTADAATTERRELEKRLTFVSVNVHRPHAETRLFVNNEEIRRQAWGEPTPTVPGAGWVELVTPGRKSVRRDMTLKAGERLEIVLDAERDAPAAAPGPSTEARHSVAKPAPPVAAPAVRPPPPNSRVLLYTAATVAVVGYGAFGILGTLSEQNYDTLEEQCAGGSCPPGERERIDTGRQQQLWANIGLALGVVATGAAVTLWFLEPAEEETVDRARLGIGLSLGGVSVRGRL
jgi:hypothetical protein